MSLRSVLGTFVLVLPALASCGGNEGSTPNATGGATAGAGNSGGRGGTGAGGSSSGGPSAGEHALGGAGAAGRGSAGAPPRGGEAGLGQGGEPGGNDPYPPETPLLERAPELAYDCSVPRPMALLGLPWSGGTPLLGEGGPYLARVEGDVSGSTELRWSTLAPSGALGTAKLVYEAPGTASLSRARAAAHGEYYALVWQVAGPGDQVRLFFADVNGAGEARVAPKALDFAGTRPSSPLVTAAGEGLALAWLDQPAELTSELKFTLLGEDGTSPSAPRVVAQGSGGIFPDALAKIRDGFLLVYSRIDYAESFAKTFVLALDGSGAPRGTPAELPGGFGSASILVRGDKALIAWGAADNLFDFSDRAEILRVGWFDANGAPLEESSPLQAPVVDEENEHPHFVDFGDDIGLFWSQGSVIYICAGCFPDNHVKFVILDGASLRPKSALLDLPSPNMYGLLNPEAVRLGDDVLVTAGVTRHVDGEGASARLSCPVIP